MDIQTSTSLCMEKNRVDLSPDLITYWIERSLPQNKEVEAEKICKVILAVSDVIYNRGDFLSGLLR